MVVALHSISISMWIFVCMHACPVLSSHLLSIVAPSHHTKAHTTQAQTYPPRSLRISKMGALARTLILIPRNLLPLAPIRPFRPFPRLIKTPQFPLVHAQPFLLLRLIPPFQHVFQMRFRIHDLDPEQLGERGLVGAEDVECRGARWRFGRAVCWGSILVRLGLDFRFLCAPFE